MKNQEKSNDSVLISGDASLLESQEPTLSQVADAKQDTPSQDAMVQQETSQLPESTSAEIVPKGASNALQDLESVVLRYERNVLNAGKALNKIKESKMYKKREKSWSKYCRTIFGFSSQYANRLIIASRCSSEERMMFEEENRRMAFDSLPPSVNFWKQASGFKDAEKRHASLNDLLDGDNKLVADWSTKWDEAVKANRAKPKEVDDLSAKDEQLSELATKIYNGIIGKDKLVSQLSALNSQDRKALIKLVGDHLVSMQKETGKEKA